MRKLSLEGIKLIIPKIINDERGYFMESYNKNINNVIGNTEFIQENESFSKIGTLRGLHFQKPPFEQAKLIRCIKGEILDVIVDIRKKSKTYGKVQSIILSEENKYQLFIPVGFAHGFYVRSKTAIVSYKVDNYYNLQSEMGIIWML